jgi:ParB/RepB/Spo0J family partition protein
MAKKIESPAVIESMLVPCKNIHPSPANNRTNKDAEIDSLAENIKAVGLLQPPTVRPMTKKDHYELVCGERRWRACCTLYSEIPVIIRELSDAEAHEITVSENMQREDLSPLEEAAGIQTLKDLGMDNRAIADKLGKPVSWVARRSNLLNLSDAWKNKIASDDGKISKWSAAHLEIIARLPIEKQDELVEEMEYNFDHMTVKDLERYLSEDETKLSSAPWRSNDETLLPEAGACLSCQKRSSTQPELFAETDEQIDELSIPKNDKCLDKACWTRKLEAHHRVGLEKAKEKHGSVVVISKGNDLPYDSEFKKSAVHSYAYEKAKKSDSGAVPAYVVDGPGAGKIEYIKLNDNAPKSAQQAASGEPVEKSTEERVEALEKRRTIRFAAKLIAMLQGHGSEVTARKDETKCVVCGADLRYRSFVCDKCSEEYDQKCDENINSHAGSLSDIEAFTLIRVFGASSISHETCEYLDRDEQWGMYHSYLGETQTVACRAAVRSVFPKLIQHLQELSNAQSPAGAFCYNICDALNINADSLRREILEEIPTPKSLQKLLDAQEKDPADAARENAIDEESGLTESEDASPEEKPKKRGRKS